VRVHVNELLFLESVIFRKWLRKNRLQSAVTRLREDLAANRLLGDVIPGGGGLRKVRMGGAGRGKQGGFRVVYTLMVNRTVALLLDGYSKSQQDDLSADELARLIALAELMRPQAEQLARDQNTEEG
jgi:hypothetical protein